MQSSKELQGEMIKPSSVISAKKQRKTIECKRLRDLFKKIRVTKGTFHAKMGTIKDRNDTDLTEAEILRGGKNTHKNSTKKMFMTHITTMV